MRHRHPFENRYCTACQCTTRHEVRVDLYTCLRCGVIKVQAPRATKPAAPPLQISA